MGRLLAAVLNAIVAVAGSLVLVHLSDSDAPTASRPALSDLRYLTESMLVDESVVPALDGTSWGRMVAVPRGASPPVKPPECSLFLSQGDATQKGLAMRSSRGAAIGVELAINDTRVDLAAVRDGCARFTMETESTKSVVQLERMNVAGLPDDAISTLMHSETTTDGQSVAWDIALIAGYHRGVLVTAEYTPGPQGGAFNPTLASRLPALFGAQVARLDVT